jgi:hypothetical protein
MPTIKRRHRPQVRACGGIASIVSVASATSAGTTNAASTVVSREPRSAGRITRWARKPATTSVPARKSPSARNWPTASETEVGRSAVTKFSRFVTVW